MVPTGKLRPVREFMRLRGPRLMAAREPVLGLLSWGAGLLSPTLLSVICKLALQPRGCGREVGTTMK